MPRACFARPQQNGTLKWHGRERRKKEPLRSRVRRRNIETFAHLGGARLYPCGLSSTSQDCVGRGLQQQPVVRRPFALSTPFVRPLPTPSDEPRNKDSAPARPGHFGAVRLPSSHDIGRHVQQARRRTPSLGTSAPFVCPARTPSHATSHKRAGVRPPLALRRRSFALPARHRARSNKHVGVRVSPARSYARRRLGSSRIPEVPHGRDFPSHSHLLCEIMLERLLQLFRKPCPSCGKRALRTRNWLRATCVDELGRTCPDSWAYESCESCGSRFKRYAAGRVEAASADEWRQYVSDGPGTADE